MFAKLLTFNPWMILGIVAALAASHGYAYMSGKSREKDAAARIQLKANQAYQENYQNAIVRGNNLSRQLAERETEIVYRTREVTKYVPQVTNGRACLSSAAVSMLNARPNHAAVPETPGALVAENAAQPAAAEASDTDVAYYIADASGQYETCAARLNALVDYIGD